MRKSKTLAKLRSGKAVIGAAMNLGPSIIGCGLAGKLGADVLWIDMEHRWFSWQDAALMILACREGGADPMVRIPDKNATSLYRCYELGATGIMLPHCRSREEAEFVVYNCKFPPIGRRGWENVGVDGDYGLVDSQEFIKHHNNETFVCLQIEDKEAVDIIDEITSVVGAELIFVGLGDLSLSYNKQGNFESQEIQSALRKIAKSCEKNGKWWGGPTEPTEDGIKKMLDLGARFLFPLVDYSTIVETWKRNIELIKNTFAKEGVE